jgi:DNA-binding winged helix-turn-helix (wHTH) protein
MPEDYQFGPFRLLVDQRELSAHGIPISLGQRAFEILLVLVSRHGHLVTKDELMDEVWPGVIVQAPYSSNYRSTDLQPSNGRSSLTFRA